MLRIYVAADCPGSPTARSLAARLRERLPDAPCEVIDVGAPGAIVPPAVFGTPIYMWNDRIIFMGNPGEQDLLACVRSLNERNTIGEPAG